MFHNPMMFKNVVSGGGSSYLLDTYTGSILPLSLRRLREDTTNVVLVRRSSDNATQEFTPENLTDIPTFCGAGDGFVQRWYYQDGIGNYADNPDSASQPRICLAGVLETLNSSPAVNFNAGKFLDFTAISGVNFSCFAVANNAQSSLNKTLLSGAIGSAMFRLTSLALAIVRTGQATILNGGNTVINTAFHAFFKTLNTPFNEIILNNGTPTTNTTNGNYTQPMTRIGQDASGGTSWNGKISEVLLFPSDMGADRAAITTEQMAYYGIT